MRACAFTPRTRRGRRRAASAIRRSHACSTRDLPITPAMNSRPPAIGFGAMLSFELAGGERRSRPSSNGPRVLHARRVARRRRESDFASGHDDACRHGRGIACARRHRAGAAARFGGHRGCRGSGRGSPQCARRARRSLRPPDDAAAAAGLKPRATPRARHRPPRGSKWRASPAPRGRRARAAHERRRDGRLERARFGLEPQRIAQQHRGAQDRRVGIGDAAAGDIGRRAVDRLEQPAARLGAQRGRGQHAERPASIEASSVRMSPNMFSVTITSKSRGLRIRCMAAPNRPACARSAPREIPPAAAARRRRAIGARSRARWPCRPRSTAACAGARARGEAHDAFDLPTV
jgi:hypothetical protein